MSDLPPPVPGAPPPPPIPVERRGGTGFTLAILCTLGGGVVFAFAWLLAKWFVNTCPEQGITEEDAQFTVARLILLLATAVWAAAPLLGARYASRRGIQPLGFLFVAALVVLLGVTAIVTLSSSEICLS